MVFLEAAVIEVELVADRYFRHQEIHLAIPGTVGAERQETSISIDTCPAERVTTEHQRGFHGPGKADPVLPNFPRGIGVEQVEVPEMQTMVGMGTHEV